MPAALAVSVRSVVFGSGRPTELIIAPINFRKNGNMHSTQITPNTLKTVCAIAALFAVVLPTEAAMFAAMVVPIFSPKIMAAASLKGITPVVMRSMMMAMVAAEDWKQIVRTVPMRRKISTERLTGPRYRFVNACRPSRFMLSSNRLEVSLSLANPTKKRANPMMISPSSLIFLLLLFIIMMKPRAISGKDMVDIS